MELIETMVLKSHVRLLVPSAITRTLAHGRIRASADKWFVSCRGRAPW
jgi:hypothetical protein